MSHNEELPNYLIYKRSQFVNITSIASVESLDSGYSITVSKTNGSHVIWYFKTVALYNAMVKQMHEKLGIARCGGICVFVKSEEAK